MSRWIIDHLWLIPAVPLAASLVILSLSSAQRKSAAALAVAGQIAALAMSVLAFLPTLQTNNFRVVQNFTWFTFGEEVLRLGFVLDPLAAAMLMMIALVGLCIFVFSIGYMADDKRFTRFFAYLSFFSGAMLGLVIANSALMTFPDPVDHAQIVIIDSTDQRQDSVDTSVGGLAIGGGSNQTLAQVVTAGRSGNLYGVSFPLACDNGDLIVEIQNVTGGQPNGTVLTSQTIPAAWLPVVSPNWLFRTVRFTSQVFITAGTQFAIVLKNPTGSCGVFQGPIGDSYAGGEAFYDALPNGPGWVLNGARHDLPFETIMK